MCLSLLCAAALPDSLPSRSNEQRLRVATGRAGPKRAAGIAGRYPARDGPRTERRRTVLSLGSLIALANSRSALIEN